MNKDIEELATENPFTYSEIESVYEKFEWLNPETAKIRTKKVLDYCRSHGVDLNQGFYEVTLACETLDLLNKKPYLG